MSHMWTWKYDPFDTTEYGEEHLREEIRKIELHYKPIIEKTAKEVIEKCMKEFGY